MKTLVKFYGLICSIVSLLVGVWSLYSLYCAVKGTKAMKNANFWDSDIVTRMDHALYNGAILIGISAIIILAVYYVDEKL